MRVELAAFYPVAEIAQRVQEKVAQVGDKAEAIDYLTFAADGEPTLDINLGKEIEDLRWNVGFVNALPKRFVYFVVKRYVRNMLSSNRL